MNHLGTVKIETERLLLRPFVIGDAEKMYENWANDPEVTKHLSWPPHSTSNQTRESFGQSLPLCVNSNYYNWAVVLKDINEPVGNISSVHQSEDIEMLQIGYCIGRLWWHRGITSEALAALIGFFFEQVGANRIEAFHDINNPNSGKVMQKCGMQYEGTMRQGKISNQGIYDAECYAILAGDYLTQK